MRNDHTLNVENMLVVLRQHAMLIVACTILTSAAAYGFSKAQTEQYTASAKLLFRDGDLDQQASGVTAAPSRDPQRDSDTNVQLVTLRGVAEHAARALGDGMTPTRLLDSVEVTAAGGTDLALVAATSSQPRRAAAIANTLAESFVAMRREADRARIEKARQVVQRQILELPAARRSGLEAQSLRDRDESLRILASLQTGGVELAERAAVPTTASSPKTSRNVVIGLALGLVLGVGLAFIANRLDRRIKAPQDLGAVFELPLLGVVPNSRAYRANSGAGFADLPAHESEAFRTLRAHLRYYNVDSDVRTVLVTSAVPGEGKTTVAQYLAQAAASMGANTLVIEADLRRPSLAARLNADPGLGLGDVLIRSIDIQDAVHRIDFGSGDNGRLRTARLEVLFAGTPPPNPAELIESRAMQELLGWVHEHYDFVVIDTPPLDAVSDAISLLRKVDGVIIVSRLGKSTTTSAVRLRERLLTLGAPVLGVVANAYSSDALGGHGYAYDYKHVPPPQTGRPAKKAAVGGDGSD